MPRISYVMFPALGLHTNHILELNGGDTEKAITYCYNRRNTANEIIRSRMVYVIEELIRRSNECDMK